YTVGELAAALGVAPESVAPLVSRYGLPATGKARARRLPRETAEALHRRATVGKAVQTANYYLREAKAFARFLLDNGRIADNPFRRLRGGNVKLDRRHDRRNLNPDELARLLDAARTSARTFRKLTGHDRFLIYATACG